MPDLTPASRRVLVAIAEHVDRTGIPPTHRALAELTGHRSLNGVHEQLDRLERRGLIQRRHGESRGILLTAAGRAELGEDRLTRLMRAFCVEYGHAWPPRGQFKTRLRFAVVDAMAVLTPGADRHTIERQP